MPRYDACPPSAAPDLRDLPEFDRRLVLAARTQLRWGTVAIFWPPGATSFADADQGWVVEMLSYVFTVAVGDPPDATAAEPAA